MPEIKIGEKMSEVVEMESVVEAGGDLFGSHIDVLKHTPMPYAMVLYVKMRRAAPEDVNVEVIWNHFNNTVTAIMAGREFEYAHVFWDGPMARTDKLVYLDAIVDRAKEIMCQQ